MHLESHLEYKNLESSCNDFLKQVVVNKSIQIILMEVKLETL